MNDLGVFEFAIENSYSFERVNTTIEAMSIDQQKVDLDNLSFAALRFPIVPPKVSKGRKIFGNKNTDKSLINPDFESLAVSALSESYSTSLKMLKKEKFEETHILDKAEKVAPNDSENAESVEDTQNDKINSQDGLNSTERDEIKLKLAALEASLNDIMPLDKKPKYRGKKGRGGFSIFGKKNEK